MSHVMLLKAIKRLAYSATLLILSSDALYKLPLSETTINAITELLSSCDIIYIKYLSFIININNIKVNLKKIKVIYY
jgi:hypothetical protein